MVLLNKEQILAADDSKTSVISVPEWGGDVKITTMSGFARDRFEASCMGKSGANLQNIRARLVAACIVDESNNLLFDEKDIQKLGKKSSKALDRVFDAAQKLNGVGDSDIEDLAKN